MCGISGIYNSSKSIDELQRIGGFMNKQLFHRGPDSNGMAVRYCQNDKRILLSHVRLSILDLSDAGHQPMTNSDNSLWITFNGEIYNYKEIRKDLKKLGVIFTTNTDTEVILAAYREWGLKCVERFIGMWAFALWDEKEKYLVLSRDRLGIKPLYYSNQGDEWYFGSEPKVIFEQVPETKKANINSISNYFSYRYSIGKESFFKNIHLVEAGTHKIIKDRNIKTIKYWELPINHDKCDPGEDIVREQVKELIESSVKYRMIADVPVGSFLSGGLDSSVLVYEMNKNHKLPIKTFTIGFEEDGFNEFSYAKEVAKQCGTDHREFYLSTEQYFKSFQELQKIKDTPIAVPNEIALYELSKILKNDITVVLSGEGADELFGGYGRIFRSAYDYQRVKKYGLERMPSNLYDNLKIKYSSLKWNGELEHFLNQYSYVNLNTKKNIFSVDSYSLIEEDPGNLNFFSKIWSKLDGLELHEKYIWLFQNVHLEGLLGRLDSATMSASVEGRVPFTDHRLIEYVNKLPLHYKLKWKNARLREDAKYLNSTQISEKYDITKYLLRSQYDNKLPSSITKRTKVGFPVPLDNWLSGSFLDYAKEKLLSSNSCTRDIFDQENIKNILSDSNINNQQGLLVWMLLNVEDWMEGNNVSLD